MSFNLTFHYRGERTETVVFCPNLVKKKKRKKQQTNKQTPPPMFQWDLTALKHLQRCCTSKISLIKRINNVYFSVQTRPMRPENRLQVLPSCVLDLNTRHWGSTTVP